MNVLIAGGTGLIGRALVKELLLRGHSVSLLSRNPDKVVLSPSIKTYRWDGRSLSDWVQALRETDVIINLAGENIGSFPWTNKRKKSFRESRVRAGTALVTALRENQSKPQVFVQASAVGYYGPRGSEIIDETTGPGNDYSSSLCVDWEGSTEEIERMGIRRLIVRSGIVLSKSGGILPLMALPAKLCFGGKMGTGKHGMPWIHLVDEVKAIIFLMENPSTSGLYNLSAPVPVSNAEFMKTLTGIIHRPYWFHVPPVFLKLVLGEMSSLILDGQFVVPERLLQAGYNFSFPNLNDALSDLLVSKKGRE